MQTIVSITCIVLLIFCVDLYLEYRMLKDQYEKMIELMDIEPNCLTRHTEEESIDEAVKIVRRYCSKHTYDKCQTCRYVRGYTCAIMCSSPIHWEANRKPD